MNSERREYWIMCAFLMAAFFFALFCWVYWRPATSGKPLCAPDLPATQVQYEKAHFPAYILRGKVDATHPSPVPIAPTATRCLLLWLPVETYRWGAFALNTVLIFAASLFLLRTKALPWLPCFFAATAMSFWGESFSIIAAGHLGKFGVLQCAILMLAFLDRLLTGNRWRDAVGLGVVTGCGFFEQPDVMMLFLWAAFAYVLYRRFWKTRKVWQRFAVAGMIAAVVAAPYLYSAVVDRVAERSTMVASSGLDQWHYATGWSLPPEELVDMIIPFYHGRMTGDPVLPYIGRVGANIPATITVSPDIRQYLILRQHGIHIGLTALLVMLAGLWYAIRIKAKREYLFWFGAAVVAIILALGHYTPLYSVFFHFPLASSIRAPLKWLHVSEVAMMVLLAYGLRDLYEMLSDDKANTLAIAMVCILGCIICVDVVLVSQSYVQCR